MTFDKNNSPSESPLPRKWILLRGLIRSPFHWQDFDQKLLSQFPNWQIIKPELAGNGLRNTETSPDEIDDAVSDIRNQIKKMDFDPAHNNQLSSSGSSSNYGVIAISLGGMLALEWVKKFPNEISHLVLINSSLRNLSPSTERLRWNLWPQIIKLILTKSPERIENFIVDNTINDDNQRRVLRSLFLDFQKKHPIRIENFFRQLSMATQSSVRPGEINLEHLKLLVLASTHDRLVHVNCSRKIAASFNTNLIEHPWAGHDLPTDDSNWVIEKLTSWLNRP